MMACLDVAYSGLEANAAAVLFHSWDDSAGERCFTKTMRRSGTLVFDNARTAVLIVTNRVATISS